MPLVDTTQVERIEIIPVYSKVDKRISGLGQIGPTKGIPVSKAELGVLLASDNDLFVLDNVENDWYVLRKELGFFEETIQLVDAVDPSELESYREVTKNNSGETTKAVIRSRRTPGQIIAQQNLAKLAAYLIEWSHDDPITLENIKRIPRPDSRILMAKIVELEDSTPAPFLAVSDSSG